MEVKGSSATAMLEVTAVKYVLLFCGTDEDAAAFAALSEAQLKERYVLVGRWFAEHRSRIGGSNQLLGPETATSVRFGPTGPGVVTDGPFLEGKEQIGGYAEIDVANLMRRWRWRGHGRVVGGWRSVRS